VIDINRLCGVIDCGCIRDAEPVDLSARQH
jgi:hypothetical protein